MLRLRSNHSRQQCSARVVRRLLLRYRARGTRMQQRTCATASYPDTWRACMSAAPTAAAISAALAERTAAYRAVDATAPGTPERVAARQRCHAAVTALDSLKTAARRAFTEPRGWKLSPTKRTMDHPVIDHAEVYLSQRRIVAVVTHSYAPR